MTDPSKEALEMAMSAIYGGDFKDGVQRTAAALQKLMDAQGAAERELDLAMKECDRQTTRAEAAERELADRDKWAAACEKAAVHWKHRAEAAEASKAQLIREVRDYYNHVPAGVAAILAHHEKDGS